MLDMTDAATQPGHFLTIASAAKLAGIGRTQMHHAAVRGDIPYAVVGGWRFFRAVDVLDWRAARREVSHAAAN